MAFDKDRQDWLWQQEMNEAIMEELILTNHGLIYTQLKKFHMAYDKDAYSVALEALYKAVRTFDVSKGFKFATYATVCIYNGLGCYLRNLKNSPDTVSYDATINDGDSYLSMMSSNNTVDGKNTYYDRQAVIGIYEILNIEIERLQMKPTYKLVLYAWMDSGFVATQEVIAKKVGCTQSYVSRVLKWFKPYIKNKLLEEKQ